MPLTNAERLRNSADLQRLLQLSSDRPVIIFKHSSTCPISGSAMTQFQKLLADPAGPLAKAKLTPATAAYLVVQEDRPISNEIADALGVRHESPQALVIRHGRVAWHASHGALTAEAMAEALATAGR